MRDSRTIAVVVGLVVVSATQQCVSAQANDFGPATLFHWNGATAADDETGPPPFASDRPDFTEAASTVGVGMLQMEFGYTLTYDSIDGGGVHGHGFPETLFRYGVFADWLELRVAWNYLEESTSALGAEQTLTGAEDLYLGLKIALTPQQDFLPAMALIPQMTVPTGSAPYNAQQVLPGINWIYGWDLNDTWSTAGSSQWNRSVDQVSGDNYVEFAQSWTVGAGLTERLGSYLEWYGLFPSGADTELPQHVLNGGFTFLVWEDFQLDIRTGMGLNAAADDFLAGIGGVIRF